MRHVSCRWRKWWAVAGTPEWMAEAACLGDETALWFSDIPAEQNYAKNKCFGCPVQLQCLAQALKDNEKYGIFGGTLPGSRKGMK